MMRRRLKYGTILRNKIRSAKMGCGPVSDSGQGVHVVLDLMGQLARPLRGLLRLAGATAGAAAGATQASGQGRRRLLDDQAL